MTDRDRILTAIHTLNAAMPALEAAGDSLEATQRAAMWMAAYVDAERERARLALLLLRVLTESPTQPLGKRLRSILVSVLRVYVGDAALGEVLAV